MESRIQLKESGIPLTIEIRKPSSTEAGFQCLESESTAWNPTSKTVLDSLTWGDRYNSPVI